MKRTALSDHAHSFLGSRPAVLLALGLACLATYANSFHNAFMLDDNAILFGQYGVMNRTLWEVLSEHQGRFYRPAGHVPLWFLSRFLGNDPSGYHFANLLLFAATAFFLFAIVNRITAKTPLAFLAALLYVIHPINGILVNYITASIITVHILCMQASFWSFINFSERSRRAEYLLSILFFILACLSHEMAVMLPVYLASYLYLVRKASWQELLRLLAPFFLTLGLWFIIRSQNHSFAHQVLRPLQATADIAAYFSTWLDLINWYISNLFFPDKVLLLWSSRYGTENILRNAMLLTIASGLFIWALVRWKRDQRSFFLTTFCAGLLPSLLSSFIYYPKTWPMIEPHWFFFSGMGFFALFAGGLQKMINKNAFIGRTLTACVIILFIVFSWDYNARWKSQESYSRFWLFLNKGDWTPYYGLGRALMDKGDYAGAAGWFLDGLTRCGMVTVEYASDLGHVLDRLGHDDDALRYLNTAIRIDKNYSLTYHYLGLYLAKRGHHAEAQENFRMSVALDPGNSPSSAYLERTR